MIAKWLGCILKLLQNSVAKYSIRDSFEQLERIKDCKTNIKRMLSLNVSSPVMSVSLLKTVNYVCQMPNTIKINIGLPKIT